MPVIEKPQDAPPLFGGRGGQIVFDPRLVEQLRRGREKRRSAFSPADEPTD